jgi:hypothetical protein
MEMANKDGFHDNCFVIVWFTWEVRQGTRIMASFQ